MTRTEYLENLHPGTAIREDYLPDLGWTPYRLAKELGITQSNLREVLSNKRAVTANLALRLGKLFGQTPEFWISMQARYDLEKAKDEYGEAVGRIMPIDRAP